MASQAASLAGRRRQAKAASTTMPAAVVTVSTPAGELWPIAVRLSLLLASG